jgi:hypothetical protein
MNLCYGDLGCPDGANYIILYYIILYITKIFAFLFHWCPHHDILSSKFQFTRSFIEEYCIFVKVAFHGGLVVHLQSSTQAQL